MRMAESGGAKFFPAGWNVAAKLCDSCKNVPALLFCRKDSMFLCMACDVKMHAHTRHERVWMCEACEHAPASVTCKADAAALCVTCDRDIHTANPLARRHDRIPVVPFYDCVVKSNAGTFLDHSSGAGSNELNSSVTDEVNITWGIPTDTTSIDIKFPPADMKSIEMLFSDPDHLLEFDFPVPTDPRIHSQFHNSLNDSVVPVQSMAPAKHFPSAEVAEHHSPETLYEIDFTRSSIHSYNKNGYASQSLSHSVSSSSMDVGVVPEGNSMSEISYPFMLPVNGGVELNGATTENRPPTQLSGKDREARVLRYREKKKNRKFEKTIRYASRKAYAETRPRIKGRFAKRTESTDLNVDRWFFNAASNCYGEEAEYGVVPSF